MRRTRESCTEKYDLPCTCRLDTGETSLQKQHLNVSNFLQRHVHPAMECLDLGACPSYKKVPKKQAYTGSWRVDIRKKDGVPFSVGDPFLKQAAKALQGTVEGVCRKFARILVHCTHEH